MCRIHDLFIQPANGATAGAVFLAMEYLSGPTLASKIRSEGVLPPDQASSIALQLCSALNAAHEAGVIHRDFKSGNIMLESENSGDVRAVVTDFGLARDMRPSDIPDGSVLTQPGAVIGTPGYMAPEQFGGRPVSPATDIFALGVVLFEMATGRRPFAGDSPIAAAFRRGKHLPAFSPMSPGLDQRWDSVIRRCLEYEPQRRFQSAREVAEALQSKATESKSMPMLRRRFAVVALVVLACIAAVLWLALNHGSRNVQRQKLLAVLPFENLSGNPSDRLFCDGLQTALASTLSQIDQLDGLVSVIPASDLRKEGIATAQAARKSFGANLVIAASVHREKDNLRLFINLVDPQGPRQIQSRKIELPLSQLSLLQDRAVDTVTDMLQLQLGAQSRRKASAGGTTVPGAYDFYVQGLGYLSRQDVSGVEHATELFQKALDRDQNYALAMAGLAESFRLRYQFTKDPMWIERARELAQRAAGIQESTPVHITLGNLLRDTGKPKEAVAEFRHALDHDPANVDAYRGMGSAYENLSQNQSAEDSYRQAVSLRPNYWPSYSNLGAFYLRHGRYSDAEKPLRAVIDLTPDNYRGYLNLGVLYFLTDRYSQAEAMFQSSLQLQPSARTYSNLGTTYFFEGRFRDAAAMMEKGITSDDKNPIDFGNLGDAYRQIPGRADDALRAYGRAISLAQDQLRLNPKDAELSSALAAYQARTGDAPAALRNIETAQTLRPDNTSVLYHAVVVYELLGKRQMALEFVGVALKRGISARRLGAEPDLKRLTSDPRYLALVR